MVCVRGSSIEEGGVSVQLKLTRASFSIAIANLPMGEGTMQDIWGMEFVSWVDDFRVTHGFFWLAAARRDIAGGA